MTTPRSFVGHAIACQAHLAARNSVLYGSGSCRSRRDILQFSAGAAVAAIAAPLLAADAPFPPFLYAAEGAGKILRYDKAGKVDWERDAAMSRDVWALPNDNVLFCYNDNYDSKRNDNPSGVMQVSRDGRPIFHFKTTGHVWSCQRLADGSTLVGASSQGKLLIVDEQGKVKREIQLINKPGHSCIRNARQIAGGHFLVAEESARSVREYDEHGKLARELPVAFAPYSAIRLKDGVTLACGQQTLVLLDDKGKIAWQVEGKNLPQLGIRWFAGVQVLPDGSIFVCNAGGKVTFFTLGRDGKVLWQSNPGDARSPFPMGHGVHRLDVEGEALK